MYYVDTQYSSHVYTWLLQSAELQEEEEDNIGPLCLCFQLSHVAYSHFVNVFCHQRKLNRRLCTIEQLVVYLWIAIQSSV